MDRQIVADLVRQLESHLPDVRERIYRSLGDANFQDMCSEYKVCTQCLYRWSRSPDQHVKRIEEYTELITDLRQEILHYLQEHQG